MASSGTIGGSTDHQYIEVTLDWSLNWQDADSNTSAIHVDLWARRTNVGYQTWGTFVGGIRVAGTDFGTSTYLTLGPGNDWVKILAVDKQIEHSADGSYSAWLEAYGGISGTGWNTTGCSGWANLNQLIAYPPQPTSCNPVRQSDSRIDVSIGHGEAGARNPIQYTELEYRGIYPPTSWKRIMDSPGRITLFTDKTASPNSCYQYSASTRNSRGSSNRRESDYVYTTPGAPGLVLASKASDLSITVSWSNGAAWAPQSFKIYDNDVLVQTVAGSVGSWRHTSPDPGVTHTYKVSAVQGSLESAKTASQTVQLLAPPLAPSGLSPDGAMVLTGDVVLSWLHNSVDSTPQESVLLRYRLEGSEWTTVEGGAEASLTVDLVPGSYEWQVQTKGAAATFGPWSDIATAQVITAPTVTLTAPPATLNTNTCTASWTWGQAEDSPQSQWQATLLKDGSTVEERYGTGPTGSVTFSARLTDATGYQVSIVVGTGGITATASTSFTTDFPLPGEPSIDVSWVELSGLASVSVAATAGDVATLMIDLERSVDGGLTWEQIIDDGPLEFALSDRECLSNGPTLYRANAWSDLPSSASTTVTLNADSDAHWLSGGQGFAQMARLPYNVEASVTAGLERTQVQYEGRSKTVAYAGQHTSQKVSASGIFIDPGLGDDIGDPGMSVDDLIAVAQVSEPVHMFRDPDGRRVYGMLSEVQISRPVPGARQFSFTVTETEK